MPLTDPEIATLQTLQTLCIQVEQDAQALLRFTDAWAGMRERKLQLEQLYTAQWARLTEPDGLTQAQRAAFDAAVPEGHYSILGEDTIWYALEGADRAQRDLLKALAAAL